jgi:zinc protease
VSSALVAGASVAAGPRVLIETSRALPLVSMTVAVPLGSAEDPAGKEGLLRFASRLMRRTGGGLSAQEIDTRIDSLGGSLGSDVSHSTSAFHATLIRRSLEPFVALLGDVLARPSFSEEELGRLRRESESEIIEARDNDRSLARRWFRRRLFEGHAYARPVSGTLASLGRLEQADVGAIYRRILTSSNTVLAFAGDIDAAQAERVAGELVAALPPAPAATDELSDPSFTTGRRLVIVDKPERTQTQILIGGSGTHAHDEDHVALHVANTVFGGTFTARMTREVRSKRGWSYGAYSSLPIDRRRQAFSMWTFPKAADAAPCIKLELELLKEWRERGITKAELAWAKRYLVRSHAFSVDTAAKRVGLQLDAELYRLPPRYHEDYIEHVKAVTLDQANAAVRSRIPGEDFLVCVVGTESEIGSAVRGAIDGLTASEVVPFDADE